MATRRVNMPPESPPPGPQLSRHASERLAHLKAELAKDDDELGLQPPPLHEDKAVTVVTTRTCTSTVTTSEPGPVQPPITVHTSRPGPPQPPPDYRVPATVEARGPVAPRAAVPVPARAAEAVPLKAKSWPRGSSNEQGQWVDGLCNCCSDCCMCCWVFCVPPIPLGQMYERAVQQRLFAYASSHQTTARGGEENFDTCSVFGGV